MVAVAAAALDVDEEAPAMSKLPVTTLWLALRRATTSGRLTIGKEFTSSRLVFP